MSMNPSTPPHGYNIGSGNENADSTSAVGARQRQPQHELPYRDDPNAPPSVRLESFTRGGYGPTHSAPTSGGGVGGGKGGVGVVAGGVNGGNGHHYYGGDDHYHHDDDDNAKSRKKVSFLRRCWNVLVFDVLCCCCNSRPRRQATGATPSSFDGRIYYEDHFNDMPWSCTVGTSDDDGIWLNRSDPAGTVMAVLVWVLIGYSSLTISLLAATGGIPVVLSLSYSALSSLALACHVKTTLTDPGSVPASAVPTEAQRKRQQYQLNMGITDGYKLSMCSQCQTFKPPLSHHCRICNRCISRMDHHCPWMNNCIGAGNMKHFLLFLVYTWSGSVFCLLLLGWNYFFCATEGCVFNVVLTQLVRLMTLLCLGAFLFTSSMLMNVIYGMMTGVGTIDRLKKKATGTMNESTEEPIPLKHIFGVGPAYAWFLPLDPVFEDYDVVVGYSTPQRLLREQMRAGGRSTGGGGPGSGGGNYDGTATMSVVSRDSYGMPV